MAAKKTTKKSARKTAKKTTAKKAAKRSTKRATAVKKSTRKSTSKSSTRKSTTIRKTSTKKSTQKAPVKKKAVVTAPVSLEQETVFQEFVSTSTSAAQVTKPMAWVALATNLILPGLGPLLVGSVSDGLFQVALVIVALLTLLMTHNTMMFFVIWAIALVWSIISSLTVVNKAK